MQRREFLALLGTPADAELARRTGLQTPPDSPKADVTLRISLREGQPVAVQQHQSL
jgi:hypothetical protein